MSSGLYIAVRPGRFLSRNKIWATRTDPNFAAGRDEWVIPSGKMPSGLYIAVRPEDIFLLGISQAPGPSEIFRDRLSA